MKAIKLFILFLVLISLVSCDDFFKNSDEVTEDVTTEDNRTEDQVTEDDSSVVVEYTVNIEECENGLITASKSVLTPGQFVTFTLTPNEGYEVESLVINDEAVSLDGNTYTLFDVREDINCYATFKLAKITVCYYDEAGEKILFAQSTNTLNTEMPFIGKTPSKALDNDCYYTFDGWYTAKDGGEKVEDFTFDKTTNLYARFVGTSYTINVASEMIVDLFSSKMLSVETDLENIEVEYSSANPNIIKVSQDGMLTAYGEGEVDVVVKIGSVTRTCKVTVPTSSTLKAEYVYGAGYVQYKGNVGTIYSSQATILDASYQYVDYSLDMSIDNAVTGNFGLVFHKIVNASGLATSFYQFNFEIGLTNNIKLIRDGKVVDGTLTTYALEVGNIYNFRVVTEPSENDKVHVMCYIDGNLLIDVVTDKPSGNGTLCGIRLANLVANRFANVKVYDKTPSYQVVVDDVANGTIATDIKEVKRGSSLVISPSANEGYALEKLIINGIDVTGELVDGSYTLTNVTSAINITASFIKLFNVKINSSEHGNVDASATSVTASDVVILTITPEEGYLLETLTINGELVTVDSSLRYTIDNITNDIEVNAIFTLIPAELVTIEFYNGEELVKSETVDKGIEVTPPNVKKADNGMIIYTFDCWKDVNNNVIDSFAFETDVKLYAAFSESYHSLALDRQNYEMNALESFTLIPSTTAAHDFEYVWSTDNNEVATVDNGKVFAVGTGTTKIKVAIDNVVSECEVTVKAAEGYYIKGVYPTTTSSAAYFKNGVFIIGDGIQADIFDVETDTKTVLQYYEIELNMYIGCNVGTGANFGFQLNKTETSNGAVSTAYMLKPMTTASVATGNLRLVRNGAAITGVSNETIDLVKGNTYRVKFAVTKVDTGINMKAYVDGQLYFDYTDTKPLAGTIFGIRCASLLDTSTPHMISIISIKKISYEATTNVSTVAILPKKEDEVLNL